MTNFWTGSFKGVMVSLIIRHSSQPTGILTTSNGSMPKGDGRSGEVVEEPGDEPRLTIKEVGTPEPGPHDVLVKVGSCGLCYHDVAVMRGRRVFGRVVLVP